MTRNRERAARVLDRGESFAKRWLNGWVGLYGDYFEMWTALLDGKSGATDLIAHCSAMGINASAALCGHTPDDDQGLDFAIDDATQSVGPRQIALPIWASGPGGPPPTPTSITPLDSGPNTLNPGNVMARAKDGQLTVTLVNLRSPGATAPGDARGRYSLIFNGDPSQTIVITVNYCPC